MLLLVAIHIAHYHNAQQHNADEQCHECGGHHVAAVPLITLLLPCRGLDVALFAMHMCFGFEYTCDRLHKRLWLADRNGRRTSGGVRVRVRVELDIVVLWDHGILRVVSEEIFRRVSQELVAYS